MLVFLCVCVRERETEREREEGGERETVFVLHIMFGSYCLSCLSCYVCICIHI